MHDPREAGYAPRGVPGQRGGPEAGATGPRDRGRRLLCGSTARANLRAVPVRRRRVRAGLDPASRRLDRRGRATGSPRGVWRRTSTSRPTCPHHRERSFQAWVQVSMGCNSKCAYCIVPAVRGPRAEPAPGRDRRRGTRARARRRPRDHAPRPERQLVGPGPRPGASTPTSASCSGHATPSRESSASASRARTRRTSASP